MQQRDHETRRRATGGFTLVELLVVIAIIGLIISLVLVASADGIRRAEERATQSLITKLTEGYNDRLDALQNITAPINPTHRYLASINLSGVPLNVAGVKAVNSTDRRAQVIAQTDFIRAELPDVFFANTLTTDGGSAAANYPINFTGRAYATPGAATTYDQYLLPLGNLAPGMPYADTAGTILTTNPIYIPAIASSAYFPPSSGIFGASFSAAGGITKNLGYGPQGYDGIDNNANGLIDELTEGTPAGMTAAAFATQVAAQIANHKHSTARAEMLYAILVEGVGPLGSVFNRDEFTAKEVQDTDGDGLPEFIDAWGQPLQFYRWPIYFGIKAASGSSDSQKGSDSYQNGFSEVRELNPLDTNQLLVSPGWWADNGSINHNLPTGTNAPGATFTAPDGSTPTGVSQSALGFMTYFHSLVDPYPEDPSTSPQKGTGWDRSDLYYPINRRSYFSKVLILSGGPDQEPGVGQLGRAYPSLTGDSTVKTTNFPAGLTMDGAANALISIENQASQTDPYNRTGVFNQIPDAGNSTTTFLINNVGLDDISNHNIAAPGTGVR